MRLADQLLARVARELDEGVVGVGDHAVRSVREMIWFGLGGAVLSFCMKKAVCPYRTGAGCYKKCINPGRSSTPCCRTSTWCWPREGGLGHVGVAQDGVRLADQLLARVARELDEGVVGVGDHAVQVGARDDLVRPGRRGARVLHEKGGLPIQDRRRLLQEMYQSWPFFNTLLSNIDMVLAKKAALGMSGWRRMACGWPISSSRV